MEKELDSKIFMTINYMNKNDMKAHIEEYIRKLKNEYPTAIITKEKEIDDWYIRQRGER